MTELCIRSSSELGSSAMTSAYTVLRESMELLKPEFVEVCLRDQDCFRSEQGWEALLALLPADRGEHVSWT